MLTLLCLRTGNLRFNLPVANDPYNGTHDATAFGLSCPQQALTLPLPSGVISDVTNFLLDTVMSAVFPDGEDCKYTT